MHAPPHVKTRVYAILGAQLRVYSVRTLRFMTGQVAACLDVVGVVHRLPLSYSGTPHLGHVAFRYAARADSPRLSALQGRLSTL
ncbi:hypothetical protein COP2_007497 [Malus domestica]